MHVSNSNRAHTLWLTCIFLLFTPYKSHCAVEYNELITFAQHLESSISSGSPYYFNLCFNTDAIIEKIINKDSYSANKAFSEGFIEGIKQEFDLGTVIIEETSSGGSFSFIRAYQDNEKSKILFRLISNYGINYHEYEVQSCEGRLMIVEGYIFISAQTISELFEDVYTMYLLSMNQSPEIGIESGIENSIRILASKGKYSKAFKKWQKQSESIRYSKSFQLMGIQIAQELNKKIYFETYIEYLHYFPEESGKYMLPLNGLIEHGYYQAALTSIDKLDEFIQHDPALDLLRANLYYETGNLVKAEESLYRLIESVPDFEKGYLSLLGLYLEKKEFRKATELLDRMALTFNTYKENLSPFLINYNDFLNSQEYKNWLEN